MKKWYGSKFRLAYFYIAVKYFTTPENVYRIAHGRTYDNRHGYIVCDLLKNHIIN